MPRLFASKRELALFIIAGGFVLLFNLALDFKNYTKLVHSEEITASVLNQYQKTSKNRTYTVLKLKSGEQTLYTTSFSDLKDLVHKKVRIYGRLAPCSFLESMKSCFFQAYSLSLLASEHTIKSSLREKIDAQHKDGTISALFKTLFLADTLPSFLRNIANLTATSHLVAISGFHLGILGGAILLLAKLAFKLAHKRFPYLNATHISSAIMLVFMFGYLVLLDFSPSFLRAYLMALFGFFIFFSGLRVLSFWNLLLIVFLALCFNPKLLFSLSFALSVAGVFYVILAVSYIKKPSVFKRPYLNTALQALIFSIVIFVNMALLTHYFFPLFSPWALLSPLISLLFALFFPLSLLLHLLNYGGLFDGALASIFSINLSSISFKTPPELLYPYLLLSLLSIASSKSYIAVNALSSLFLVFLCLKFFI